MRITTSWGYVQHKCEHMRYDCERHYCPDHRLLYRTCQSVEDYGDDGRWYTGECEPCHKEFELKTYKESMNRVATLYDEMEKTGGTK